MHLLELVSANLKRGNCDDLSNKNTAPSFGDTVFIFSLIFAVNSVSVASDAINLLQLYLQAILR